MKIIHQWHHSSDWMNPKRCRDFLSVQAFFPCCMTHSASHAPMDFAIGGGYVQPQRSPREATIRWAFMPPDVSQGRGERRGLPIDAGCGRGREFEESLGQGALRRDG